MEHMPKIVLLQGELSDASRASSVESRDDVYCRFICRRASRRSRVEIRASRRVLGPIALRVSGADIA
eukprot:1802831-Rhodomonas_salina.2